MRLDWIKGLPMAGFLVGIALALSGCNTVAGAVGGLGRDISTIGDILADTSGRDCGRDRCGNRYVATDRRHRSTYRLASSTR